MNGNVAPKYPEKELQFDMTLRYNSQTDRIVAPILERIQ